MNETTKVRKTFDCVEFKRQAQERLYEETRGMTEEERAAYIQREIENSPLADFWRRVEREVRKAPKAGRVRDGCADG
jgi:hypothetical protein